ncbi:phosphatase PAP2 family protein [Flavobacterium branchiophilum]|uniref:Phosphoesterase, PA-phosphatase related n=1 Tax=Flavobacterium branchiophilum (strain FL-15) TaxID=1034807 RepID=G2Z587_FLABF|nr:phosphatase PAP2 family protein [Flavobacterium branchiophilum]CCB68593.1 Phosphoesterase, PA-phosphatase related precursor [Flavobacterium branchiophilum FL-15]
MKTKLTKINLFIVLTISILAISSCNKELTERNEQFPQLNPTNPDLNAGLWKTYLLTAPDEFAVDVPAATNSASYVSEINEIKSYQTNITVAQHQLKDYWSAGSVVRWNEIMRTLVAKHNLPPYQNPDGSYPIPSSTNPFANPQFPFSNPPYAARAFAYVSAAQYDALVAAWHFKKIYNRPAPYTVDASIMSLVPRSVLPSYPSEDAVLAGVTVEMLKLLFPTDVPFINEKAEEEKLYRIIAGANVRSDIEAGFALGKKVAAKFVTRAKTDGAGAAVGNATLWNALQTNTEATGEMAWKSLDMPARPPMLPLFGNVKSFLMTPANVVASRPVPPPSTHSAQFAAELAEVKYFATNATREQMKIVSFWADGVGTYTPPGHWNAIAAETFVPQNYSEIRWARNMALLNISLMDAAISCWDAKYFYFNPRPSQVDPSIKTLTGIPNFPAYVSGHSTFSGAAATILGHIVPQKAQDFQNMAKDASNSRLFGAIHYRSDCEKGLLLGETVGHFAVVRATTDGAE